MTSTERPIPSPAEMAWRAESIDILVDNLRIARHERDRALNLLAQQERVAVAVLDWLGRIEAKAQAAGFGDLGFFELMDGLANCADMRRILARELWWDSGRWIENARAAARESDGAIYIT